MNTVILTGRLTAEPEIKHTNNGVEVLSFCIAVKRRYTQADSEITADFINCVAWRHTAEFISKYFKFLFIKKNFINNIKLFHVKTIFLKSNMKSPS